MQEVNDLSAQFSQPLLLWIAGLVGAAFIFFIFFDVFRRRKLRARFPGRIQSSRPNYFKRIAGSFRDLREELERRNAGKARRRDRRK